MTTSSRRLFALPPFQLLVLVLILVMGLLPKNSMAQDEPAAEIDPAADDAGESSTSTSTEDPDPAHASGRANNKDKTKPVKCWQQYCDNSSLIWSNDECLKKPSELEAANHSCSSGYCYEFIQEGTAEGKKFGKAWRRCAYDWELSCFADKPDRCLHTDLSSSSSKAKDRALLKCVEDEKKKHPEARKIASGNEKGKEPEGDSGGAVRCLCDNDFCNDRTSSGPTGGKYLGCNVALVGALLVSIFPYRIMFLVG